MNPNFLEQIILLSQKTILYKLVEMYGDQDKEININLLENKFLKRPNIHVNKTKNTNIIRTKKKKRGRPRKIIQPEKKVLKIV